MANKYIDADKLIAEIDKILAKAEKDEKKAFYKKDANGHLIAVTKTAICVSVKKIIASLQQEQPEVDLDKFTEKIKTFQGRYKHPESISIKGAMAFMARMFYQYPNVARQWYEQLPKATMDNARKEE